MHTEEALERFKVKLRNQYERDKNALERVGEILEQNFKDQLATLESLSKQSPLGEDEVIEYIPSEDSVPTSTHRESNEVSLPNSFTSDKVLDDLESLVEEPEIHRVPDLPQKKLNRKDLLDKIRLNCPEIDTVYETIVAYASPFTTATLFRVLRSTGKSLKISTIKEAISLLRRAKLLTAYDHKLNDQQIQRFYQDAYRKTPIKEAVMRKMQAIRANQAENRDDVSARDEPERVPHSRKLPIIRPKRERR